MRVGLGREGEGQGRRGCRGCNVQTQLGADTHAGQIAKDVTGDPLPHPRQTPRETEGNMQHKAQQGNNRDMSSKNVNEDRKYARKTAQHNPPSPVPASASRGGINAHHKLESALVGGQASKHQPVSRHGLRDSDHEEDALLLLHRTLRKGIEGGGIRYIGNRAEGGAAKPVRRAWWAGRIVRTCLSPRAYNTQ